MDIDHNGNLELIVKLLESHPALKNSFYGFAYLEEIKALVDSAKTSEVLQSSSIEGKPLNIRIGLNAYRLEFGKKISTQPILYYAGNNEERRKYKLSQLAAMSNFDDWVKQLASNEEIVELLRTAGHEYSVLARLDQLDELGKVVSSRPLLLIPGISSQDSQKVYHWEEENSTTNDLGAKLLRKAFSIQDKYSRLQARYDDAVLSLLQRSYDFIRAIRIPKS